MALPESGMSMVLAVHANIFFRRAEGQIKTAQAANCIEDLDVNGLTISEIRMRPSSARFRVEGAQVLLSVVVTLRARFILPIEVQGNLHLVLDAHPAGPNSRLLELHLSYERFTLDTDIMAPEQAEVLDHTVRAMIEPLLGDVVAPISFDGILPAGVSLVSPVLLKMIPEFGQNGSTLLFGIEVDGDIGVNRNRFRDTFSVDMLAESAADWRLEIDSELVRQRAEATLASLDLTENAPDGQGIPNWVATTSTGVLWSGDPITLQTHGQASYILANYAEHPLWFVVEGFYNTGLSVALESRAVGHADLLVDPVAAQVLVDPHIFHAGWLFFEIPLEDQPAPTPIMNTALGGELTIQGLGFDVNRLNVIGLDVHPGMPGEPNLHTVPELLVNFKPREPGNLCKFSPGQGEMRPDGTVVARSGLANTGDAPLWICSVEIGTGDPVFSVRGEAADLTADIELQLPARVDPGNVLRFMVLMQAPDGDHEEHQTELIVRSNDFERPVVKIPVRGRKHPSSGLAGMLHALDHEHRNLLCLGRPDLLLPPDWFDLFTGLVRNIGNLVTDRLPQDALIDLTMAGLPISDGIIVRDQRGRPIGLTSAVGGLHQLSVPVNRPMQLRFEHVGGRNAGVDKVTLALSQLEPFFSYRAQGKPGTALIAGGLLFAAFDDGIHLVPLGRNRASAILQLPAPTAMDAAAGWLFVRSEEGVELVDISDPNAPRYIKTIAVSREGTFRALPRRLLVMERSGVRVYSLAPGALPVWQGEIETAGPFSLVAPWHQGVALLGASGGLISASLEIGDLARAKYTKLGLLPPMLRLQWETRVDDRTALPSVWHRPFQLRLDKDSVHVLERRPGKVRLSSDKVATFLKAQSISD